MIEKIRAVGKHILIEEAVNQLEKRETIFILQKVNADNYAFATVISASDGYIDKGKFVSMTVKAGDTIVFKRESAVKLDPSKTSLDRKLFLTEDHVFAIVK